MLPYLRVSQGRLRQRILGGSLRTDAFPGAGWAVYVFWKVLGLTSESLAQTPPETLPPVTAAKLATWLPAYLPYAVLAVLAAIAALLIFNQRLQRDLREHKRAEIGLRSAEQAKTELLDSMADSVIYLDTDQRIRWANHSARRGPKPIPENSLNAYCYAVWGDGERPCEGCPVPQTLSEAGTRLNKAVRDNEGRCWHVQSYPVKNDSGILRGVVVISRDVTKELVKEEELLKIRKLESVGVLAGGIAHDFNNMLTAVMGYISLAEHKQNGNTETGDYLRKAMSAANRAKQLAARLLTFSQGGHPIRRQVGIKNLISKAVANVTDNHPVKICTEVDPQCRLLWCDEAQIQQAVENVVINACESMPTGGEVLVRAVVCTHIEKDVPAGLLPGGYARINVSDRGTGIHAKIKEKIFDPYFTTKPMGAEKGSGLGLAITHSIVHKHQGYVSVTGRPGGGTTVSILLPLEAADPIRTQSPVPVEIRQPRQEGERILVMEDEDLVAEVAKMLLSHLGYRVTRTNHGEAAVVQFKAAQAAGDPFSAVILDLTIKGGMGGRETLEALKRYDPGVRAFVSSGYCSDPVLTNFRTYGFSGVIPKPYTLEEVQRALAIVSGTTETTLSS
jgi:two-component system, cell cycle sensor histidine kinase and response regulator CckA